MRIVLFLLYVCSTTVDVIKNIRMINPRVKSQFAQNKRNPRSVDMGSIIVLLYYLSIHV